MEEPPSPRRKKPGPVAGPRRGRYNVLIEEDIAEWGKRLADQLGIKVGDTLRVGNAEHLQTVRGIVPDTSESHWRLMVPEDLRCMSFRRFILSAFRRSFLLTRCVMADLRSRPDCD